MTVIWNRPGPTPRGSLFRSNPDFVWNYQVTLAGTTYRRSTGVRDRLVAKEVLEVFIEHTMLTHPDFPPPPPIKWRDLVPVWARHAKFRVKPRHIANVTLLAERHCGIIQDSFVHLLDQSQIDGVIAAYRARSSKGRVEALVRVLRLLVAWAEKHRFRPPDSPSIILPDPKEEVAKRKAEWKEQRESANRGRLPQQDAYKTQRTRASACSVPPPKAAQPEPPKPPPTSKRGGLWFPDNEPAFGIPAHPRLKG